MRSSPLAWPVVVHAFGEGGVKMRDPLVSYPVQRSRKKAQCRVCNLIFPVRDQTVELAAYAAI